MQRLVPKLGAWLPVPVSGRCVQFLGGTQVGQRIGWQPDEAHSLELGEVRGLPTAEEDALLWLWTPADANVVPVVMVELDAPAFPTVQLVREHGDSARVDLLEEDAYAVVAKNTAEPVSGRPQFTNGVPQTEGEPMLVRWKELRGHVEGTTHGVYSADWCVQLWASNSTGDLRQVAEFDAVESSSGSQAFVRLDGVPAPLGVFAITIYNRHATLGARVTRRLAAAPWP